MENNEPVAWADAENECEDAGKDDRDSAPDGHALVAWSAYHDHLAHR